MLLNAEENFLLSDPDLSGLLSSSIMSTVAEPEISPCTAGPACTSRKIKNNMAEMIFFTMQNYAALKQSPNP